MQSPLDEEKKFKDFPSDFMSPADKNRPEICLKWCEAMDSRSLSLENGFYLSNNEHAINRSYADGRQDIEKLKPQLGVPGKKQAQDKNAQVSWKVLSFENLAIMPKFVDVLVGKLMAQSNEIGLQAIDKQAQDARRLKRIQMQEAIVNGGFLQSVTEKTGIQFQMPVADDVIPPPENLGEVDMHMNMFYKEDYCMVVQDILKEIGSQDNLVQILSEVARDLVSIGYGATKTYRVGGKVMRRHCQIERMGCSSSQKDDFTDVKWMYEDWPLTIGQLKEIAGDQFTEEQYKDMAEKADNNQTTYGWADANNYYKENYCYPWDNTKVIVKDCVWFSPDWQTYYVARATGTNSPIVLEKEYEWWRNLQANDPTLTEESYNERNKDSSQVIRYCVDNQYQAMWVKGTKYVFNCGLSKDMLKNESTLGTTISPFTVYRLKRCPVSRARTVIDNIQINWIQYQHHAANSRPSGLSIEFSALQDISLEGAGGKKLTPKEALRLYFDKGIILWRKTGHSGTQNNWQPINELQNGLNPAAAQHFQNCVNGVGLLRDICGLNELTDASTPNSEMGKAVATMASGASDDALRPLHFGFDQINLGTAERTVMHITGMAATGMAPHYTEAIGRAEMSTVGLLSDLTHHQLGCYILKPPTAEERAYLNSFLVEGTKPGGYLYPEEAMEIMREPNIYRAVRLMKMYRQQKLRAEQQKAQQDIQANTQSQIASGQAAAQAESQRQSEEWGLKGQYEWEKTKAAMALDKQKTANQAFLLQLQSKVDMGVALTEEEARRVTELLIADKQGQYAIQVASMKPKPKAPAKK